MNNKSINIKKDYYTMAAVDGQNAEITMYGDIVESVPTDWWTGEPIDGQYIVQSEFLEDLKAIENCSAITIRMNSCGGDAGVSVLIHNRLRELAANGAELTCIVDGVAMSGGSLIMCACDNVKVNPSSLVMIHKCWSFLFGGYNADELRNMATSNDAYDKSQVSIYKRKTGLSDTVLLHMMSDTTYMTGKEAVDKGFADELIEDAEPLNIAASADGRIIFVRGREMHLTPGMFAPDTIPTVNTSQCEDETNKNNSDEGGKETMPTTVEELRETYPELVAQVEASAAETAAANERDRISAIDEVSALFDAELVQASKYGDKACTAQEMAYIAAQKAAKNGQKFMTQLEEDAKASNADNVGAAHDDTDDAAPSKETMTADERMKAARANVAAIFGKEDK